MNRWAILAVLFVARTGLGLQFQTVGSVSEEIAADLGLNFTPVGTLIGLFMLPGLILSLPAGYVGRFASDRAVVCFGLGCLALGGVLVALGTGFAMAATGRLMCGAGFVFSTVFFSKMIVDWFGGKEIATAMGVLVMSWPLAIAVGQIAHGWLAKTFNWQMAFWASSAFCMLGLLLVLLFYRAPPDAPPAASGQDSRPSGREFFLVSLASIVWAALNAAYIVYLSFAPPVLQQSGLSALEAAAVASLASWAMLVSIPLAGQNRRPQRTSGRGAVRLYPVRDRCPVVVALRRVGGGDLSRFPVSQRSPCGHHHGAARRGAEAGESRLRHGRFLQLVLSDDDAGADRRRLAL
jgi:predicted MFS family arabinose efflux permease